MSQVQDAVDPIQPIPSRKFGPVSAEKMKTIAALLQDPNPIHWDLEAVGALGIGDRPVNQGPVTMAYLVNTVTSWTGDPGAVLSLTVRFHSTVFAEDIVLCEGNVNEITERCGETLAQCALRASTAAGEAVAGSVIVRLRRPS